MAFAILLQVAWESKKQRDNPKEYLYVRPEHVKMLKCPFCEGDGEVSDLLAPDKQTLCAACQGAGGRLVRVVQPWYEACRTCGGMGWVMLEDQSRHVCETCKSWGVERSTNAPAGP